MRIQIVVFDGVDEMDFVAPFEVLSSVAKAADDGAVVELAALGAPRTVTTAQGMQVAAPNELVSTAEVIVVPGGGWSTARPDSVRGERERGHLPSSLRDAADAGAVLAAVCTGAMLLSATGLLKDRAAITHHAAVDDLAGDGARVVRARVVDDGDIVTAGGVTSGLDLALHLAARFWGEPAAIREQQRLEYERRGSVWRA